MRDFLNIGCTPCEESCQQVPYTDPGLARRECLAFIKAIRKKLGNEPEGASLQVNSFPHDFGTYHEVVCYYNDTMPESEEYALLCESDAPATWREVGMVAPT